MRNTQTLQAVGEVRAGLLIIPGSIPCRAWGYKNASYAKSPSGTLLRSLQVIAVTAEILFDLPIL